MEKANLILHWLTYACNDIESNIDNIADIIARNTSLMKDVTDQFIYMKGINLVGQTLNTGSHRQ